MGEDLARKLSIRFEIHCTPKHASWLNRAESAIGMYSRQCLEDRRVGDIQSLKNQTAAWKRAADKKRSSSSGASPRPRPARAWVIGIDLCGKTLLPEY
jgi:hypothetical protein